MLKLPPWTDRAGKPLDTAYHGTDILADLLEWIGRFPAGEGFPSAVQRNFLQAAADEIARLRRMENEQSCFGQLSRNP